MTFLLCDPGWYVQRTYDVQNQWEENTQMTLSAQIPRTVVRMLGIMVCYDLSKNEYVVFRIVYAGERGGKYVVTTNFTAHHLPVLLLIFQ